MYFSEIKIASALLTMSLSIAPTAALAFPNSQPNADGRVTPSSSSSLIIDPQGTLQIGDDSILRSLGPAPGTLLLETRRLNPTQLHSIGEIFSAAGDAVDKSSTGTEGSTGTCDPPVHCVKNGDCQDGCAGCTTVSWFPYSMCIPSGALVVAHAENHLD